jgi:hypothetical protein
MKSFKLYSEKVPLSEGAFKVGSVMEGIFAIAVAQYLHAGVMPTVAEVNKLRKKIIPSDMAKSAWTMNFSAVTDKRTGHPTDTFNVKLVVRLKKGEMVKVEGGVSKSAFGPDGDIVVAAPGEIPDLDAKIISMLAQLSGTNVIAKIDKFIEDLLVNNTKDKVLLFVDADGVSGESSGGLVKGDVSIKILAKIGGKKVKKFAGTTFAFSLKSDSNTYANRGAIDAIESLSAAWGIPYNTKTLDKISKSSGYSTNDALRKILTTSVTTEEAMIQQSVAMGHLFDFMIDGLVKKPISNLKDSIFYLLKLGIFGSDYADVIEFKTDKIKELTMDRIHDLWNHPAYDHYVYTMNHRYAVLASGNTLARKKDGGVGRIQIDVTYAGPDGKVKTDELCHFRAKLNVRKSSSGKTTKEFKLMFEGGKFLQTYGGKNKPPTKAGYDPETLELTTAGQAADYIGAQGSLKAPKVEAPKRAGKKK